MRALEYTRKQHCNLYSSLLRFKCSHFFLSHSSLQFKSNRYQHKSSSVRLLKLVAIYSILVSLYEQPKSIRRRHEVVSLGMHNEWGGFTFTARVYRYASQYGRTFSAACCASNARMASSSSSAAYTVSMLNKKVPIRCNNKKKKCCHFLGPVSIDFCKFG